MGISVFPTELIIFRMDKNRHEHQKDNIAHRILEGRYSHWHGQDSQSFPSPLGPPLLIVQAWDSFPPTFPLITLGSIIFGDFIPPVPYLQCSNWPHPPFKFMYLAVLGLSCSMWDLQSSFQHTGSLVVACEIFLVMACKHLAALCGI